MRIETGGSLRTWGQWQELVRDAQRAKERAIIEAIERQQQRQVAVQPLDGNVVGGPLDGARMPVGTREGLQYEWDGKRWRHVR